MKYWKHTSIFMTLIALIFTACKTDPKDTAEDQAGKDEAIEQVVKMRQKYKLLDEGRKELQSRQTYNEQGKVLGDEDYLYGSYTRFVNAYDEQGRLKEKKRLDADSSVYIRWEYEYADDRKVERHYNKEGELDDEIIYTLNEKGDIAKLTIKNMEGGEVESTSSVEYIYDEGGNLVEVKNLDSKGKVESKHIYAYDDKGNEVEMQIIERDGEPGRTLKKEYDDAGNLVLEKWYNSKGGLDAKTEKVYNDDGLLVSEKSYRACDPVSQKCDLYEWVQYEYDADGRVVKETFREDEKDEGVVFVYDYEFFGES